MLIIKISGYDIIQNVGEKTFKSHFMEHDLQWKCSLYISAHYFKLSKTKKTYECNITFNTCSQQVYKTISYIKCRNIFIFISVLCNSYFLIRGGFPSLSQEHWEHTLNGTPNNRGNHTLMHLFTRRAFWSIHLLACLEGGSKSLQKLGEHVTLYTTGPWSCEVPTLSVVSPCCLTTKQVILKSIILIIRFLALVSLMYGFSLSCEHAGAAGD